MQSHVQLEVISNAECRASFGSFVFDTTLCTRGTGPVGVCSSDSGGPLSTVIDNETVLVSGILFLFNKPLEKTCCLAISDYTNCINMSTKGM